MKTVLITGGAKGIGRAIALELSKENYNVFINYNKSELQAKELKQILEENGVSVEIYRADLTKREEVSKMVSACISKFGNIDVVINNAGIDQIKLFTDVTDVEWNNIIQSNLYSVFYTTQEALKQIMINKKDGCIINISSIWGKEGASCEVAYSASKAGINGFTKALAKELGPSNIRVNAIAPGIIDTDMNKHLSEDELKEIIEEIPLQKIGTPQNIAKCVKWLIEDNYTTGQIIEINGGWSM